MSIKNINENSLESYSNIEKDTIKFLGDTLIKGIDEDKIPFLGVDKAIESLAKEKNVYASDIKKYIKATDKNIWRLIQLSNEMIDLLNNVLKIKK